MPPKFIIHEHITQSPHFDLRLELDGGVKSWIIPKFNPLSERMLAVEDWDVSADLIRASRGIIGDGYGIGDVSIWDAGDFTISARSKIRLEFQAFGERFTGGFVLLLPGWGIWGKKRLWALIRR